MPRVLFFDTETTGLPVCSSAGFKMLHNWPDVVQLAYTTSDSDEIVCEYLKPTQALHPEAVKVHGITQAYLDEHAQDPRAVFERFLEVCGRCDILCAHNLSFDYKVILAQLFRLDMDNGPLVDKQRYCTMRKSCNLVRLKPRLLHGKLLFKYPKLQECAEAFAITTDGDYHDARTDVDVLKKLYSCLQMKYRE